MPRFLEIVVDTSTTLTYINLDKVNIVQLNHNSVTFHFGDKENLTTISNLTSTGYEKLRRLLGAS